MEEQCICVQNLTKAFSGRVVVDALSFGVKRGEVMPLGIGIDLLKSVSLRCYDRIVFPVLTLIAITAVCGFVAVKTFRWE